MTSPTSPPITSKCPHDQGLYIAKGQVHCQLCNKYLGKVLHSNGLVEELPTPIIQ